MEQNAKQLDCDESEGKDETETVIYEGNGEDSSSAAGQQVRAHTCSLTTSSQS
jgi:hypothetical protein